MEIEVVFAPEVEQDLGEAYRWYEQQRPGLGEEFLGCVDACVRGILRTPEIHAKVYQGYRRALVRRFPFAVFYEFSPGRLTIYCILHTSRNPEKWRSRLR